jgi:hypothetical protein
MLETPEASLHGLSAIDSCD